MKLIANALACERNGRVVFSGLSFDVSGGELVELRGANGAGKSSLLRLLAGLVPKSAGTISLQRDANAIDAESLPQHLHLIAHQDAMKPALSVAENLSFWASVLGGSDIQKALQAFTLEPLRHDPVQLLSAGQRRRLALSRLFLAERPLWLLDEPATALDKASISTLSRHMQHHLQQGGAILAAIHGDSSLPPSRVLTLGTGAQAATA